jgi:hypothetical protein
MRRLMMGMIVCLTVGCDAPQPVAAALTIAPAFRASCLLAAMDVCTEHTEASFALGEESVRAGCLAEKGLWSPARCPNERRVGTCATRTARRAYYGGHFTSTTAARDCVELYQGAFTAK